MSPATDSVERTPAQGIRPSGGRLGARAIWLALLALALAEVVGHFVLRSRVPPEGDWERAAAFLAEHRRETELLIVAPGWADPLLREHLGAHIRLEDAGRSDLAAYSGLWVLSLYGHRAEEAPARAPDQSHQVGRLRLDRWSLPGPTLLYDLGAHLSEAEVSYLESGQERSCRWTQGQPAGGGLGQGAIKPAQRFECDARSPEGWVGLTLQEDLSLRPRRCVRQHPRGPEPVIARFEEVPMGERLVLYGGLYYEDERDRALGPAELIVHIDGRERGRLHHEDGDGWERVEIDTHELAGRRVAVEIRSLADNPHKRSLCWAASTRRPPPGRER